MELAGRDADLAVEDLVSWTVLVAADAADAEVVTLAGRAGHDEEAVAVLTTASGGGRGGGGGGAAVRRSRHDVVGGRVLAGAGADADGVLHRFQTVRLAENVFGGRRRRALVAAGRVHALAAVEDPLVGARQRDQLVLFVEVRIFKKKNKQNNPLVFLSLHFFTQTIEFEK